MAVARTPAFDSALHVIKGAAVTALKIPTGRTTSSVKQSGPQGGKLVLKPVKEALTEDQQNLIKKEINDKVKENAKFRIFNLDRATAEKTYGETMYDSFLPPDDVKTLRLVCLDKWNLNANRHPVVASTGLLTKIEIIKQKHNANKQELELTFHVHLKDKDAELPLCPDASGIEASPPALNQCVPGEEGVSDTQKITPWEVEADEGIDYDKLSRDFGCSLIDEKMIARFEKLTGRKPHRFLRRGLFFSHREMDTILDNYEKGIPFYLYTGRGPSSDALHIGHLVPMHFTQWLQEVFDVPLVIQITDDEKFFFKENLTLEGTHKLGYENIKDIIACGFNPDKTFIFSDLDYMGTMYPVVCKLWKLMTYNQAKGAFGFVGTDNVGKSAYPAIQAAPSFSANFPHIFGKRHDISCLIPCAIDQDPFFRVTRDIAPRLKWKKPSLIHSKFFPALGGYKTKMSASGGTTIFVTDSDKMIKDKINKHCVTGGRQTVEEHRKLGADLSVDVAYEYLRYLMDDDEELERIRVAYGSPGEKNMLSGEIKQILIKVLQEIVHNHQEKRAAATDEVVQHFMNPNRESLRMFD